MSSHTLARIDYARDTDLGITPSARDRKLYGPTGRTRPQQVLGICSCGWRGVPYPPTTEPLGRISAEQDAHAAQSLGPVA